MLRKITLPLILLMLVSTVAFGQIQGIMRCEPVGGYQAFNDFASGGDSASYYRLFVFDIPEGGRTDTLHLLIWGDATDYDEMDLNVNSFFGFKKSSRKGRDEAYYAWSPESTAVIDDFNTELYAYAYALTPTADDTLFNGPAGQRAAFTAVKISVISGGSGNGSDVDYAISVVTSVDHTK